MPRRVITEDLGKIAEMALCQVIGTPYGMAFNYPQSRVDVLVRRFSALKNEYSGYTHTGASSQMNDFTSPDTIAHLSLKTCKKGYKICPQEIGQPCRKIFCSKFGMPAESSKEDIKKFLVENINTVMPIYVNHTFHCPMIFYNEKLDKLQIITMNQAPIWENLTFTHLLKGKPWNESSTLKIGATTIGEFQIHAHRNSIKFRFNLNGLLDTFKGNFTVRDF